MADELDQLLNDVTSPDEKETVATTEVEKETSEAKPSAAQDQAAMKEVTKLRKKLAEKDILYAQQEERLKRLESVTQPFANMGNQPPAKPDYANPKPEDTQKLDWWKGLIDQKINDAMKPVSESETKKKNSEKTKAVKAFIASHPDYNPADEKGRERMKGLLEKAARLSTITGRSDSDSEDILEDFNDAWAMENRAKIERDVARLRESKDAGEMAQAEIAATGSSSSVPEEEFDATPAQRRAAQELGMDTKVYLKNLKKFESQGRLR